MEVLLSTGLCLMIVGGGCYLQPRAAWNSLCWYPLSMHVDLHPGTINTPFFRASDLPYRIKITVDSGTVKWEELRCLLGRRDWDSDPPCPDPDPIDIAWSVVRNGANVRSGRLQGFAKPGGGTQDRVLGGFKGEPDGRYALQLRVNKESAQLDALSPRLEIEGYMPEMYSHDISQFLLSTVFLVGTLIVVASSIPRIVRRRKISAPQE